MDNIGKFCIAASIFMIFFNFSVVFVGSLGVFPVVNEIPTGDTSQQLENITGQDESFFTKMTAFDIFALVGSGGAIALAIGWSLISRNLAPVGTAIFGALFFTSFFRNLGMFISMGFFSNPHVAMILGMLHTVMVIIFVAALIYMLKGSE